MAFESWFEPETVAAISAAVATVLGAVGVFIKRVRTKGGKELFVDIHNKDMQREKELAVEAIKAIQDVVKAKESADKRSEAKSKETPKGT